MGQDVTNQTRFCQIPQGSKKGLNRHLKPRTIMAVSLAFLLTTTGLVYYLMLPPSPPLPLIPPPPTPPTPLQLTLQAAIAIDGDANFSDTALLEGWPGDGSPENPFIIDSLNVTRGQVECIDIRNTRVNFIICNFSYIGAPERTPGFSHTPGIYLYNVTNGELVNNTCIKNEIGILLDFSNSNTVVNNTCNANIGVGIYLDESDSNIVTDNTCSFNTEYGIYLNESVSNTVANNTCADNYHWGTGVAEFGICLEHSDSNTVANNSCTSNGDFGIYLDESDSNIVTDNTCNFNTEYGISLDESDSNTVANNTCNSNDIGINLEKSDSNTVSDNICNYNRIGIRLDDESDYNIVASITFLDNTEHDIIGEYITEEVDPVVLLLIGPVVGITLLGAGWRMLSGIRKYD